MLFLYSFLSYHINIASMNRLLILFGIEVSSSLQKSSPSSSILACSTARHSDKHSSVHHSAPSHCSLSTSSHVAPSSSTTSAVGNGHARTRSWWVSEFKGRLLKERKCLDNENVYAKYMDLFWALSSEIKPWCELETELNDPQIITHCSWFMCEVIRFWWLVTIRWVDVLEIT